MTTLNRLPLVKTLKKFLIILLALVAVTLIVALFLPARYHVQRSITIQARPETISPYINNLKRWPEWTAWNKEKDPTVSYSYEGPDEGVLPRPTADNEDTGGAAHEIAASNSSLADASPTGKG